MRFNGICLITENVPRLMDFYTSVLQVDGEGDDVVARIFLEGRQLDICSRQGMEDLAPGSTYGMGSGGISIDIEVEHVDEEYERLKEMNVSIVKVPETYPWGRRSFWFRDPEGNIVNFYSTGGNVK